MSTYCDRPEQIPVAPHYVVIRFQIQHIPGDRRSEEAPGHGYPAYNMTYATYWQTSDRAEWEREIAKALELGERFKAMHVDAVANVKRVAQVEVAL